MVSPLEAATRLIDAYNDKDFSRMAELISPNLDFAHFNRDFVLASRDELIALLQRFADELVPDRRFLQPERVTVQGAIVVREGYYTGTPRVDLPSFGPAGATFKLKFCSVMRFDEQGVLLEWKDYG